MLENNKITKTVPKYINTNDPNNFHDFCRLLNQYFDTYLPQHRHELVLICIGTDRATGDSLGPLIGYKLKDLKYTNIKIYGTLDEPVHAKNLHDTIIHVQKTHPHALVISIDACLGSVQNIGCVSIGEGSIRPGAGVQKELPAVGDLHIIGIVNLSSAMNMSVLQNTRLSVVMKMADLIASGVRHCSWVYSHKNKLQNR
ncbi:MAG: spore protease YyaC [Epulopiscium sp. Nele67-Bin005]|nr:MAG: spore protease YyaC [Epulopiscium sp. Nele67-Bin005]